MSALEREKRQEKRGGGRREGEVTEKSNLYAILSTCHMPLLQTAPHLNMAITYTVGAFLEPEPLTQLSVVGRSGTEM